MTVREGKITNPLSEDESWTIGVYAVLARDCCDFVDMLEDASQRRLELLLLILESPGSKATDTALNQLGASIVRKRLPARVITDRDPGDESETSPVCEGCNI